MFLFPDNPHHALAAVTFHPSHPWLLLVSHSQHWIWFDFERGMFTEQSKQQLNNFPAQVCYFEEGVVVIYRSRVVLCRGLCATLKRVVWYHILNIGYGLILKEEYSQSNLNNN